MALHPAFAREALAGSSGTTVLTLVLATIYGLVEWVSRREIRHLLYVGAGAALMVLTSFETSLWLAGVFVILAAHEFTRPARPGERGATLLLAAAPVAYAAGLWVLMNWLIMGDAAYFLRSLRSPDVARLPLAPSLRDVSPYGAAAAAALLVTLAARRRGDRGGVCAGAMGMAPLAALAILAPRGWLWHPTALALCMLAAPALALGHLLGRASWPRWTRLGLLLLPLGIAALAWNELRLAGVAPAAGGGYAALWRERQELLPRLASHVLRRSRYARVFVCGYDGFRLLAADPEGLFLPALDFNFNKAKDDYRGQTLFVLVRRPAGLGGMDSVHWKYPGLYALGSRNTLYEADWGAWRLFEIVEPAPRRLR